MKRWAVTPLRALTTGHAVTGWSFVAILALSFTIMLPLSSRDDPTALLGAALVGAGTLAAALGLVALLERWVPPGRLRGTIVVAGTVVGAALKPVVQDAWLGELASGGLSWRIATNVIVWVIVVTTTALIVDTLRSLRATNALLRDAGAALEAAASSAREYRRAADELLRDTERALRLDLDGFGARAHASTDDVRAIAERLRSASHTLAAAADSLPGPVPALGRETEPSRPPLRLPPVGVVAILYAACILPYALRAASALDILVGALVLTTGSLLVDAVSRTRVLVRRRGASVGAFVGLSALLGALLAGLAGAAGVPWPFSSFALVVYPGVAAGSALCTGALVALRAERRRLSTRTAAAQRAVRTGTRSAQSALREAASLLHRDAQGACFFFVLAEPHPSAAAVTALAAQLRDILDRMSMLADSAAARPAPPSLAGLLETWRRVMTVRVDCTADARAALEESRVLAEDAFEIVAEGMLNAAKHGTRTEAEVGIELVRTGAGRCLRLWVRSPGSLSLGTQLREDSPAALLGARLTEVPGGVRLEGVLPHPDSDSVVSTEHPR